MKYAEIYLSGGQTLYLRQEDVNITYGPDGAVNSIDWVTPARTVKKGRRLIYCKPSAVDAIVVES